ncbi:hypothetical protein SRRS_51740 [Sporomusa rhizae]|uniref:N-acyl amino acid synthase FeeM domain-containing protein n=1 Tax=Sporomusa rhizae TaxID=357999 RepID=UPI00352ACE69
MNENLKNSANDIVDNTLQVRIATQTWEKKEVYKLRYDVYVAEMDKPLDRSIQGAKQITDALDDQSYLIYVQAGSEIVATQRITIASAKDYPADLSNAFHMQKFNAVFPHSLNPKLGLGTKLAIKAPFRNSPAFYLILTEAYRLLRSENSSLIFTGGNPYVIPLYERVGFRRYAGNFTDPGYSLLIPLVMLLEDTDHFRSIKSPMLRLARKYVNDPTISKRFVQIFPEVTQHLNTRLITRDTLWEHFEQKLGISPFSLPLFNHLDAESIKELLISGMIFSCYQGDNILYENSFCNDLYILLSGTLEASSQKSSRFLMPGSPFGNFTFTSKFRQAESILSLTDSELFILTGQAHSRYTHLHQHAAEILLHNIINTHDLLRLCAITTQGGENHE